MKTTMLLALPPFPKTTETADIRLYTLGTLRMERNVQPGCYKVVSDGELHHKRVQMLLASLLCSPGRRLGREQLMGIIWPDEDDIVFLQRELDRAVYDLRQLIEPEREFRADSTLLLGENGVLTLADQSQVWTDADAFLHLLQEARATTDTTLRKQGLMSALSLYKGEFFLSTSNWTGIANYRFSLWRAWHCAMLDLVDLSLLEADFCSAAETLNHLLFLDPTDEDAALQFIFVLAYQCRRIEAIRFYQKFHERLRERHIRAPRKMSMLYRTLLQGYTEETLRAIARGEYTAGQ